MHPQNLSVKLLEWMIQVLSKWRAIRGHAEENQCWPKTMAVWMWVLCAREEMVAGTVAVWFLSCRRFLRGWPLKKSDIGCAVGCGWISGVLQGSWMCPLLVLELSGGAIKFSIGKVELLSRCFKAECLKMRTKHPVMCGEDPHMLLTSQYFCLLYPIPKYKWPHLGAALCRRHRGSTTSIPHQGGARSMLPNGERERSGTQFPALILWLHSSWEVDCQEGLP